MPRASSCRSSSAWRVSSCSFGQSGGSLLRASADLIACQAELGQQRHELLLDAIMDVPLDTSAARLLRLNEACP